MCATMTQQFPFEALEKATVLQHWCHCPFIQAISHVESSKGCVREAWEKLASEQNKDPYLKTRILYTANVVAKLGPPEIRQFSKGEIALL